jgi:hypothetical protein
MTGIEKEAIELIGEWVRARDQFEATMKAQRRQDKPQTSLRPWEDAAVDNLNLAEDAMKRFWIKVNA